MDWIELPTHRTKELSNFLSATWEFETKGVSLILFSSFEYPFNCTLIHCFPLPSFYLEPTLKIHPGLEEICGYMEISP